ncbi:MAG: hypothetical protein RL885_22740 [Planctomycetota bacterium]
MAKSRQFNRVPFIIAVFGLIPAAFDCFEWGKVVLGALTVLVILLNILAAKQGLARAKVLDVAMHAANSALCSGIGWSLMEEGKKNVHWAWFLASAFFAFATVSTVRAMRSSTSTP